MSSAILPDDEAKRQASLERMQLLSTPREAELDRIVRIAQRYFRSEAALISLVDRDRQWFKARRGFDAAETCRAVSFCSHAILRDEPFVVDDTLRDARFVDNPLVLAPQGIRFYAGQSLRNLEGHRIGTLCVMSSTPRSFDAQDVETLQDLARLVELALERRALKKTHQEVLHALRTAERESLLDPMTGLWNRRGLEEIFRRELEAASRRRYPLALAMIDIDHFKSVNDTHGHATGDAAIRRLAEVLVGAVRSEDAVARYGGDEFVVLLPDLPAPLLTATGERLLRAVRQGACLDLGEQVRGFTVSVGISVMQPGGDTAQCATALLEAADAALYRAKDSGRNRCEIGQARVHGDGRGARMPGYREASARLSALDALP